MEEEKIICPTCSRKYREIDFLASKMRRRPLMCYICLFEIVLEESPPSQKKCPVCKKLVPKSRPRYCSAECCDTNTRIKSKSYWLYNIRSYGNSPFYSQITPKKDNLERD